MDSCSFLSSSETSIVEMEQVSKKGYLPINNELMMNTVTNTLKLIKDI